MERLLDSAAVAQRIRQAIALHQEQVPDTVGTALHFELLECDAERGEFALRCETAAWMGNILGSLHGGMSATALDHAMGHVANAIREKEGAGPTVQLQVTYHRPLTAGDRLILKVQVLSVSKTLTQLEARAYSECAPDKLCVSATGTYYFAERR